MEKEIGVTMKKIVMLIVAAALLEVAGVSAQTFKGVITDSMCGADHKAMKVSPDSKCVLECVKAGSKYALYDGKNVYVLSDQTSPAKFAAQKLSVTGVLDPKTKVIKVESIQPDK